MSVIELLEIYALFRISSLVVYKFIDSLLIYSKLEKNRINLCIKHHCKLKS